jgi:hypothetical protein
MTAAKTTKSSAGIQAFARNQGEVAAVIRLDFRPELQ